MLTSIQVNGPVPAKNILFDTPKPQNYTNCFELNISQVLYYYVQKNARFSLKKKTLYPKLQSNFVFKYLFHFIFILVQCIHSLEVNFPA